MRPVIWEGERAELLLRMRQDGQTYTQMARAFGVSKSAIAGALWRLRNPWTPRPRKTRLTMDDRYTEATLTESYAQWKARKMQERGIA